VQSVVIFSVPWSIASVVDIDSRQKFDRFYRQLLAGAIDDLPVPSSLADKLDVPTADDALIYDFCYQVRLTPRSVVNCLCVCYCEFTELFFFLYSCFFGLCEYILVILCCV